LNIGPHSLSRQDWPIKIFENFFVYFYEKQGKKISRPSGQNLDRPNLPASEAAMTFKHKYESKDFPTQL
jgi:hypothetical protein